MNFYDEEITISGPDTKHMTSTKSHQSNKIDRLPSGHGHNQRAAASRQRSMLHGNSTDDDGLLQDIIDHDDAEDSEDEDDSELQGATQPPAAPRPQTRPGSMRNATNPSLDSAEEDENDEQFAGQAAAQLHHKLPRPPQMQKHHSSGSNAATHEVPFSLTPEKWEHLPLSPELKELFPYILKYTPQSIETPCHLQPFIPEFVPAVGDVDALLKVQAPPLLLPQRQQELDLNLQRLGLWLLDEPSGTQSEPSLMNMKLRSVLSGGRGRHARHASSASLVPTARSPKDIDKWISEVEQVHMTQSMYDTQPQRKDIDALLEDWPHYFAEQATSVALDHAYRACLQNQISLADYVRVLSEQFGLEGPLDTQADYIYTVQTLFALYLVASQAWE